MKSRRNAIIPVLALLTAAAIISGCSSSGSESGQDVTVVRIGHNQATDHPIHIALTEFEEFIEAELGDKYDVEIYPNELLGSQTDMVQLTQTGAIEFSVASNSILETFSDNYTIFNLPYLFAASEAFQAAMAMCANIMRTSFS